MLIRHSYGIWLPVRASLACPSLHPFPDWRLVTGYYGRIRLPVWLRGVLLVVELPYLSATFALLAGDGTGVTPNVAKSRDKMVRGWARGAKPAAGIGGRNERGQPKPPVRAALRGCGFQSVRTFSQSGMGSVFSQVS